MIHYKAEMKGKSTPELVKDYDEKHCEEPTQKSGFLFCITTEFSGMSKPLLLEEFQHSD